MSWSIICGKSEEILRRLPPSVFHSLCTDPPAAIKFMAKKWDRLDKGGRNAWIGRMAAIFAEAERVLRPGAFGYVWAIPQTSPWTRIALEDAGFEPRDRVHHVFGSGMPHTLDASKAVDAHFGYGEEHRPIVSSYHVSGNAGVSTADKGGTYGVGVGTAPKKKLNRTIGYTEEARKWDGWHSGLRPGCEDWHLVRKSFDAPNNGANLVLHGAGALNIDATRIPRDWGERGEAWLRSGHTAQPNAAKIAAPPGAGIAAHPLGGWPANVVFTHSEMCVQIGERTIKSNRHAPPLPGSDSTGIGRAGPGFNRKAIRAVESIPIMMCTADCPVRMLDEQGSPDGYDQGAVSRYFNVFYHKKAPRSEREAGLAEAGLPIKSAAEATNRKDGQVGINRPQAGAGRGGNVRNDHPTVKDLELMRWLIRQITPPGGIVLDIFCGSGSTGIAAVLEGFEFLGIDEDPHYCEIARARIAWWEKHPEGK